ncbi:MAG: hypothetical protein GX357_02350 [Firmicutes bacterium]|nr:hypothetical protein [Bacillota bacterium]
MVRYLQTETAILNDKPQVLMMSGVDRFGMAQALDAAGCHLICGDLIFVLGVPIALNSLKALERVAHMFAPIVAQLPFSLLYPTGAKQEENTPRAEHLFQKADIIAGDFHFIRRFMPSRLEEKIIITNTTTPEDVQLLQERGVKALITTTPEFNGRSFGTNVMEALLVALSGKKRELEAAEYEELLVEAEFIPRITWLS